MTHFKAEMHQIAGGAHSAPPDPPSWIEGVLLLKEGREGQGKGGGGEELDISRVVVSRPWQHWNMNMSLSHGTIVNLLLVILLLMYIFCKF